MAYNEFKTLTDINRIGLDVDFSAVSLFPATLMPCRPSETLLEQLRKGQLLARMSNSEKAKSEWLIAPVLAAFWANDMNLCSVFSGVSLNVDNTTGLVGELDFVISRGKSIELQAPILVVVESKKSDIKDGLFQICAEMLASRQYNHHREDVYGLLTTGIEWQFLQLGKNQPNTVVLDCNVFGINEISRVLDILRFIIAPNKGD